MRERSEHQEQAEPREVQRGFLVAMYERYRVSIFAFGLVGILLVIAIITAPTERELRDEYSNHYNEQTCENWKKSYSLDRWFPPIVSSYIDCQERQTGREEYQSNENTIDPFNPIPIELSDLLAQRRMAHWTVWIAIFTSIGLVTLFFTLLEANKTATFAFRSYEATKEQLAPQIYVGQSSVIVKLGPGEQAIVNMEISIENAGATIARDVSYQIEVAPIPYIEKLSDNDGVIYTKGAINRFNVSAGETYPIQLDFKHRFWDFFVDENRTSPRDIRIRVYLSWSDFDGRKKLNLIGDASLQGLQGNLCQSAIGPFVKR